MTAITAITELQLRCVPTYRNGYVAERFRLTAAPDEYL